MPPSAAFVEEVVEQVWKYILTGLSEDEDLAKVETLKTWFDVADLCGFTDRVDLESSVVFSFHLEKQKARLLELARTEPGMFDTFIGVLRYHYGKVAAKVLKAYNGGKEILANSNSAIDLLTKQEQLFDTFWKQLYAELAAFLETGPATDKTEWSLVAVKLRRRELHDESTASSYWLHRCPFQTSFMKAYRNFELNDVKTRLNQAF